MNTTNLHNNLAAAITSAAVTENRALKAIQPVKFSTGFRKVRFYEWVVASEIHNELQSMDAAYKTSALSYEDAVELLSAMSMRYKDKADGILFVYTDLDEIKAMFQVAGTMKNLIDGFLHNVKQDKKVWDAIPNLPGLAMKFIPSIK